MYPWFVNPHRSVVQWWQYDRRVKDFFRKRWPLCPWAWNASSSLLTVRARREWPNSCSGVVDISLCCSVPHSVRIFPAGRSRHETHGRLFTASITPTKRSSTEAQALIGRHDVIELPLRQIFLVTKKGKRQDWHWTTETWWHAPNPNLKHFNVFTHKFKKYVLSLPQWRCYRNFEPPYRLRTSTPDAEDHGELFWSGFGWDDSHRYAHTEAKCTGIVPALFIYSVAARTHVASRKGNEWGVTSNECNEWGRMRLHSKEC